MPLRGNYALYDQAVDAYGEMVAFNLISKNAVAAYDEALQANNISNAFADYPHTKIGVKISRTISQVSYEKAQRIFDPLGLLPPGTLAANICKNAISYYLKTAAK